MITADEHPLSELYATDIARLRRLELDAILARHRMNFEAHRLIAANEKRHPTKEFLS